MVLAFFPTEDSWQQVYFIGNFAETSRLVCPVLLNSPVVALIMSAPIFLDANKWRLGAYIQREVFTGLTVGGSSDARLNSARKLYVNRLQVFTFSEQITYSLVINPFIWGEGTTVTVWEYTGEVN
ncbi:hypothetical protein QUB10_33170 [Microcoleus sp. B5-D4]|uniref:hypothetical protein n=1 Tax=Microcoleus sp. B5-D4 TaxID=2818681 RepID=UPI002FD0DD9A